MSGSRSTAVMPDGEDARPAGGALRTAWLVGVVAVAGVCALSAGRAGRPQGVADAVAIRES